VRDEALATTPERETGETAEIRESGKTEERGETHETDEANETSEVGETSHTAPPARTTLSRKALWAGVWGTHGYSQVPQLSPEPAPAGTHNV
jgi:hypothetical protein